MFYKTRYSICISCKFSNIHLLESNIYWDEDIGHTSLRTVDRCILHQQSLFIFYLSTIVCSLCLIYSPWFRMINIVEIDTTDSEKRIWSSDINTSIYLINKSRRSYLHISGNFFNHNKEINNLLFVLYFKI